MEIRLIDTNILFEYYSQSTLFRLCEELLNMQVLVIKEVLTELYNLLKNKRGVNDAIKVIETIMRDEDRYKVIWETAECYPRALEICRKYQFKYPNKDYSLVDGIQLAFLEDFKNVTLFTTDARMKLFKGGKVNIPFQV